MHARTAHAIQIGGMRMLREKERLSEGGEQTSHPYAYTLQHIYTHAAG